VSNFATNFFRLLITEYATESSYRFGQAKFAYGGLVLGSGQFTLQPQLPLKTTHDLKVDKISSKISSCFTNCTTAAA